MQIIFGSGICIDKEYLKSIHEPIKSVIKKELPEEYQTSEVIKYVLEKLIKEIDELRVIL
ncbi:MAG: hypothetical protein HY818_05285 [Acetobacterium woodii]|nr:hypothetical protein [Acetobacterium woodii]